MTKLVTGLAFDIGQRDIYEDRVAVRRITTRSGLDITVALVAENPARLGAALHARFFDPDPAPLRPTFFGAADASPRPLRPAATPDRTATPS